MKQFFELKALKHIILNGCYIYTQANLGGFFLILIKEHKDLAVNEVNCHCIKRTRQLVRMDQI